jgi:tetratricopeptide (TPR) repeat protein
LDFGFLQAWSVSNWISFLEVIGAFASIIGLPLAYLAIRKPRWRKYRCRGLPYERIFRRGDYGYNPQMFLNDVGSVDLALRELSIWYADGRKPLLLRGVTGVGKSRLVTEFIGGLGFWHRLRTRVLVPTPHEFNEKFPPLLPGRYILFLNDLHEFSGVPDDKLRFYAEDRRFRVVATIPSEKYDIDWSVLSGSIWRKVEVEKWEPEEGRRLAETSKTFFQLDSFTGTPLSVIAPAAEIRQSYELLARDRKAVLEALKIVKAHLGCFVDYELLSMVPVRSGKFDKTAFTDIVAKQRFWCKIDDSTAMLADGMEEFVEYAVSIDDAYKLEAVLMHEEGSLRNRDIYLLYLGNFFFLRMGESEKALKCYDLSEQLGPQSPLPSLLRGNALRVLGRLEEALDSCGRAMRLFQKLGDQFGIVTCLDQLAGVEEERGNYDEACKLCNGSLMINRKLGDQSGIAKSLDRLATIEYSRGNYDESSGLCNESLMINRKLGDQSGIASNLLQLAMIEEHKGNYDEASKLYNESLTINRKLRDRTVIATTKSLYQSHIDLVKERLERVRKLKQETAPEAEPSGLVRSRAQVYCRQCGRQVRSGSLYCDVCGARL